MALCPQCDDSVLVHTMLTEGLAGHSCGKCLGTLVSLVSYRAWRERMPRGAVADTPAAVADAADSIGAKKCPKCRSLMSKYRISAERHNRLDYCPHCEEIWLDDGEWELVESLVSAGDFARVFTQAWQYSVREGVTAAMQEQRLRELLGHDYQRVLQFASWLGDQPARAEILELIRGSRPSKENAALKGRRS